MDQDKSDVTDTYVLANYAKVTDSPLMYTKPNYTSFNAGGMDLVLGVYSPTGKYKAADFKDNLEKMVVAQKKFLGDMNTNKKYAIMLYLSGGDNLALKVTEHWNTMNPQVWFFRKQCPKKLLIKALQM